VTTAHKHTTKNKDLPKWAKSLIYILTPIIIGLAPFITQIVIEKMKEKAQLQMIQASQTPQNYVTKTTMAGMIQDSTFTKKVMEAK
jgi:hypothetical protein